MNYRCSYVIFSSPNLFNFGHRNFYFCYKSIVVIIVIVPNFSVPFMYGALQQQFTELQVSLASIGCMTTLFTFCNKSVREISFGPIRQGCSTSPEVQNIFAYYAELSRSDDGDQSCP